MTDDGERFDKLFDLQGRVAIVTGGGGVLGRRHRAALASVGATVVSLDLHDDDFGETILGDVTDPSNIRWAVETVIARHGRIDILINNAAHNPRVEEQNGTWSRFESFSLEAWNSDLAVGLTGSFLVAQVVGSYMAANAGGVILNVCSDLSLISPDQRLYRQDGLPEDRQPVKPVSYSVVKHGLLGLTRYLATYWADRNVRVNAISPGGVEGGQDARFVTRLSQLIPLGRMARQDEYAGAVIFLCSDASSYMTGHNLVIDGGRTVW